MDVVLLRHGIAEDRSDAASPEEERERALTERGRRRLRKGLRGLVREMPRLSAIATSPLARAVQTAEIAAATYGGLKPDLLPALEPGGSYDAVLRWLAQQSPQSAVMLVGHRPDLEDLAAWLLAGVTRPLVALSKGGACLLHIEGAPGPGMARLGWSLPASVLRRIS